MANYKKFKNFSENNKNIVNEIKKIPIVNYAGIIGYTPIKIGRYYTLKEADSVRIDPEKNCFFRNSNGAKGSIIDFAMEFENKDIKDVIHELSSLSGLPEVETEPFTLNPIKQKEDVVFTLPNRDTNIKNAYAYLINTRKIDKEIVNDFIKNKNLYQDEHKNCVFVSYNKDGKADFASLRGTNTFSKFIGDVKGSNYDNCFLLNNKSNILVVTESVIDAMSLMSLTKNIGANYKDYNYLSLSGTMKYQAVKNQLNKNPNIDTVILAVDNDNGGYICCRNIKEDLEKWNGKIITSLPTKAKDWNAELCDFKKEKLERIDFAKSMNKGFEIEKEL